VVIDQGPYVELDYVALKLGIGIFSSMVISNNGYKPVALKPLIVFDNQNASSLTRIYIDIYLVCKMQLVLSREAVSVLAASARFSGENMFTLSGCNMCDVYSGSIRISIACSMHCEITFAVM
jgi:hypothetical protein